MAFDYKKEYKEFYLPKNKPEIIEIPKMKFIAVKGKGNPNAIEGEYKEAMRMLYGIAFTIKMSYKGNYKIDGYFSYVVPPLEGFWTNKIDYQHKEKMTWISLIRLPDFVTKKDFEWAINEATTKKSADFSKVQYLEIKEGLCVQCLHKGSYDNEPATIELMHQYIEDKGYEIDITENRHHHEIYLSDPRRCVSENLKTVIRLPIKKR